MTLSDRLTELLRNQAPYAGVELEASPVQVFFADLASRVDALASTPFVFSVSVAPATVSVAHPGTTQLTATVEAQGGAATTVTWASATPGVATVDAAGLVTTVSAGTSVITATSTFDGTKSGSSTVTVT